jgi:UDP-N-acetylmuramoyl-L-alanine---L-glutamate ligase
MRFSELSGKHVVVWGAGVEGRAAVSALQRFASVASLVVVVDKRRPSDPSYLDGVPVIDMSTDELPASVQVVVKSPGVSPYMGGLAQLNRDRPDVVVTGGTALWFAEAAADSSEPLSRTIAVTGSKGKSTTSSLIAHLLVVFVDDVLLAGNVGRAPLDVLTDGLTHNEPFPPNRWFVFELSSFQTSEIEQGPLVGVLTALFPEHLDWHLDAERYYLDKMNLFRHGGTRVVANFGNADVQQMAVGLASDNMCAYEVVDRLHVDETGAIVDGSFHDGPRVYVPVGALPLTGRHNAVNAAGALSAIAAAGFDLWAHREALLAQLATFRPLANRLEPIGTVGGRLVIDDGLSTAPQAAIAALAAYPDVPVGIVIGGHDRGLDYDALANALSFRQSPTWVVTVPESGRRIGALIAEACVGANNQFVTVSHVDDFDNCVEVLLRLVPDGGVILLSPAAPSFGRFRDYKERSVRFRELLGLL